MRADKLEHVFHHKNDIHMIALADISDILCAVKSTDRFLQDILS